MQPQASGPPRRPPSGRSASTARENCYLSSTGHRGRDQVFVMRVGQPTGLTS